MRATGGFEALWGRWRRELRSTYSIHASLVQYREDCPNELTGVVCSFGDLMVLARETPIVELQPAPEPWHLNKYPDLIPCDLTIHASHVHIFRP